MGLGLAGSLARVMICVAVAAAHLLVEALEVLLGVAPDLGARPRPYVLLN